MSTVPPISVHGSDPAWDIARLFPGQGAWSEEDYFELTEIVGGLVELTDGNIEVLEMPTEEHQLIVMFLVDCLRAFVEPKKLGRVLFAPLRVRIRENKFREPDVLFMLAENTARRKGEYWLGADLVMEVVSDSGPSRDRDFILKRQDYAEAGIREYWIVDPRDRRITVLALEGNAYVVQGEFSEPEAAQSRLLTGLSIDVSSVFAAAKQE